MTIEQFPSSGRPQLAISNQAPKQSASGKSVTLLRPGGFALHFEGANIACAIAPEMAQKGGQSALLETPEESATLIELLALDDAQFRAIKNIASEHDLSFSEAVRFHLAMTLPE